MTSECKHRSYQTVPMNGRKCNDCGRWLDDEETAMTSECLWCGAERELRLGCCFDCATTGEERAAQRTVAEHIAKGFNNLAKRNGCAKHDFKWAWERLTNTGDYAPNGYFAAFGIQTRRQP